MEIRQKWVALNKKYSLYALRSLSQVFENVLEECRWVGSMELRSQMLRILKR